MEEITKIYVLKDPRCNSIRYCGKTISSLSKRVTAHKYNWTRTKGTPTHVDAWIKNLSKEKLFPIIELIDEVSTSEWQFWEKWWIFLLKSWGCELTNHSEGGNGRKQIIMSEETKKKIVESRSKSEAWKEYNKRHSKTMKDKFKNGDYNFLWKPFSKERKLRIAVKSKEWHSSEAGQKYKERISIKVKSINKVTGEEIIHPSQSDTAKYFGVGLTTLKRKLEKIYENKSNRAKLKDYEFSFI